MSVKESSVPQSSQAKKEDSGSIGSLSLSKKLFFAFGVFAIFLLLMEATFRLLGIRPAIVQMSETERFQIVSDELLGYRYSANVRYVNRQIASSPVVSTDEFGFRKSFGWNRHGETPIVLFLGDSTIFCAEVDDNQTATSEVAKRLMREVDVRVLNGGVRGYSTLQSSRMLEKCFAEFSQVDVAVYVFTENDLVDNLHPARGLPLQYPTVWWHDDRKQLIYMEVREPIVPWGTKFSSVRDRLQPAAFYMNRFYHQVENDAVFRKQLQETGGPGLLAAMEELSKIDKIYRRSGSAIKKTDHKRFDAVVRDWLRGKLAFCNYVETKWSALKKSSGPSGPSGAARRPASPRKQNSAIATKQTEEDPDDLGPSPTSQATAPDLAAEGTRLQAHSEWSLRHHGRTVLVALLKKMKEQCARHGCAFIATCFTRSNKDHVPKFFAACCAEAGVEYVSVAENFVDPSLSYAVLRSDGTYDLHYGSKGTRVFAAGITERLIQIVREKNELQRETANAIRPTAAKESK